MFTASKDGSIVKWSLSEGQRPKMGIRKKFAGNGKNDKSQGRSIINAMAISHDGKFLATGNDAKLVNIWKCDKFEHVRFFQGKDNLNIKAYQIQNFSNGHETPILSF